jgi:hypothetical protein
MKRIQLSVPDAAEFAGVRDLDGTFTEVANPKEGYRFKRDGMSVEFTSTGRTVRDGGTDVEVFVAAEVRHSASL